VSAENVLFPYNNQRIAEKRRNNMSVATAIGVKEAAKRARNRKGGLGVSRQYVQIEILRYIDSNGETGLKATKIDPPVGKPYYIITEEDFLAWEEKRGRSPGDEP
jgi:hypothetical protein